MHFFYKVQVWGVQRARILTMNHVISEMKLGYCSKQRWAIFRRFSGIIQPFTLFSFLFFYSALTSWWHSMRIWQLCPCRYLYVLRSERFACTTPWWHYYTFQLWIFRLLLRLHLKLWSYKYGSLRQFSTPGSRLRSGYGLNSSSMTGIFVVLILLNADFNIFWNDTSKYFRWYY